jgi:tight adherence protein B
MIPLPLVGALVLIVVGGGVALYLGLRRAPDTTGGSFVLPVAAAPGQAPRAKQGPRDVSPLLSRTLDRMGVAKRLQYHLLQAGLLLRPSELAALVVGFGAAGFLVGLMLHKALLGPALAVATGVLPLAYVNVRKAQRRGALANQLGEALGMMASSLRSGYSFMRAMQVVRDEMDAPISEEFGRVLDEMNVGVSHERALQHLLERCPTGDIELVVTACQIQANVGGNLAQILDTTSNMIRERARLQGEIAALTAEGRLSAGILVIMPPMLAALVSRLSPGYLDPLIQTQVGMGLLGGAVGSMIMGILVIKKMLAVRI